MRKGVDGFDKNSQNKAQVSITSRFLLNCVLFVDEFSSGLAGWTTFNYMDAESVKFHLSEVVQQLK